jgi:hypothetical protein
MQRFGKQSVAATAITLFISALALLVAQGRIFPHALANTLFAKPLGDICYLLSLPGVMVAVAIWGYSSDRTALSDTLVVAVNGALYALPIISLLVALRHSRKREASRKEGAEQS